ncbi:MAG: ATP-binding cassette domain-containing protein, partial [Angelakisella sp.]
MLKIEHISKTFNTGTVNEKKALCDVSLHLEPGDFVTVIGGNGAGKSTLLNMVAGVFQCDRGAGSILLDGENITRQPEHKRARLLGRVFQDPMRGTASDMGIEENLAMAYRRGKRRGLGWGITDSERKKYVEVLGTLDLGLETRLKAKVGLLSGGQRQAITLLM